MARYTNGKEMFEAIQVTVDPSGPVEYKNEHPWIIEFVALSAGGIDEANGKPYLKFMGLRIYDGDYLIRRESNGAYSSMTADRFLELFEEA